MFGDFRKKRPSHETKRRWKDVVKSDVEAVGVGVRCVNIKMK